MTNQYTIYLTGQVMQSITVVSHTQEPNAKLPAEDTQTVHITTLDDEHINQESEKYKGREDINVFSLTLISAINTSRACIH